MSSGTRGRGRGYMGRGGSYHGREDRHHGPPRGDYHSGEFRGRGGGGHYGSRGGGGSGDYGGGRHHKEMSHMDHREYRGGPPRGGSDRHHQQRRGDVGIERSYEHRSSGGRRSSTPSHSRGRSPASHRRPDQILAKLAPDEQVALTKALVDTVLRRSDTREKRGYRDDREGAGRHYRDEGNFRDGGREFSSDRRAASSSHRGPSRYQGREDRSRGISRGGRGGRGFRGSSRGGSGRHEMGPHQRLGPYSKSFSEGSSSSRRKYEDEHSGPPFKKPRLASGEHDHQRSGSRSSRDSKDPDAEGSSRDDGKRSFDKQSDGPDPSVRKYNKNSIVDLQCPHCPGHCSITIADYKYHLQSNQHLHNMDKRARRHSQLLLKLRKDQRTQQKEIETEYLEKHPDQVEVSVTNFCPVCKLNYRCLGGDMKEAVVTHNKSKLHKIQTNLLHPRCQLCNKDSNTPSRRFKSRMIYDHHVASVSHLIRKNEKMDSMADDLDEDDDIEEKGFMTLDSVGDGDEEDAQSEHDEITGDSEAQELAKKAAQDGAEVDSDMEEGLNEDGTFEPVGLSYVQPIKVYFCSLCLLNVKNEGVSRHCTTPSHRNKYFAAKKKAAAAAKAKKEKSDKQTSGDETEETKEEEEEKSASKENEKDTAEQDYENYNEKYESYSMANDESYEDEEEQMWGELEENLKPDTEELGNERTNGEHDSKPASEAGSNGEDREDNNSEDLDDKEERSSRKDWREEEEEEEEEGDEVDHEPPSKESDAMSTHSAHEDHDTEMDSEQNEDVKENEEQTGDHDDTDVTDN